MKNIQTQIILIFTILGIAVIAGLGIFYNYQMQNLEAQINLNQDITQTIETELMQINEITIYAILLFIIIAVVIGTFVRKLIIKPMYKLTKNATEIAEGKMVDMNNMIPQKIRTDIDDLVQAFCKMNNELNEKFNEATRQKKQIETILLHMTDGIIAFDIDGEIIHINPAAKNLLELEEKDNNFDKIFDKLNLNMNIEKIIYLENWTSTEQKINVKDRYVNLLFAPFKDENDRPAGVIAVIQDITEHVKLDNMRKEFVADVSHELKTPITSIMGYADTLLETDHDKEIETKFLGVISSEAKRMSKLVTDLLSLSRFDSNKTNIVKEEFDLGELAKKCQEKLQIEIDKKHLQVHCLVTANVPPVYAEKDGIERVIINILSNSIKYTNENGTINIYVGFVYNDAYIKFIDTGIGIPEEDLERIFERFYRVDKARTREMGGTGLGLSIAKEILDRNNGTIDIKSKLNEGTEVVIRIPTKTNNKFILKEEENLNEGEARRQPNIQEQKDN